MSKLQLPIAETPIKALQYLAYPLCALLSHQECLPWFYNNYIQLEFVIKNRLLKFVDGWLTNIPVLEVQKMQKKYFFAICKEDIDHSIGRAIRDGWYFYSVFDEFYVPNRFAFQKEHFFHDFLLYGYNDSDNTYSILGYTKDFIFEPTEISYKNFDQAFQKGDFHSDHFGDHWIFLFRKMDNLPCHFNLKYVYDQIYDYFYGIDTTERIGSYQDKGYERVFGLNVYDCLINYFTLLMENEVECDFRSLQVLGEHKKCMLMRLRYMSECNFLEKADFFCQAYQKLMDQVFVLRDTQVQYFFTKEIKLIEKIIKALSRIKEEEYLLMDEMIKILQKKEEVKFNIY